MTRAVPDEFSDRTPSPETSISDKENQRQSTQNRKRGGTQSMASNPAASKRQRLADRASNIQGTQSQFRSSQADPVKRFYDPDQDEVERRWIRKGLRDLSRDLNGNRYRDAENFLVSILTGIFCRFPYRILTIRKPRDSRYGLQSERILRPCQADFGCHDRLASSGQRS